VAQDKKKSARSDKWYESIRSPKERKRRSEQILGKKNPAYKHGNYALQRIVKKRDDFTCKRCKLKDEDIIIVDHIIPRRVRPDLIFKKNNMQTLCPNCHAEKTIEDRAKYGI